MPEAAWECRAGPILAPPQASRDLESPAVPGCTQAIDRVDVKIYSREKTLVDCFKFRNRVGMAIVLEALHLYCGGPRRGG